MAVKARLEFIEKEMYVLLFRSFPFLFLHNDDGDDDDDDQKGLTLLLYLFPNLLITKGGKGGRGDIIFTARRVANSAFLRG